MSASSSIAAAKRRRGGLQAPTPQPGQRPPVAGPQTLTPQQRALLLQQQQLMAQKGLQHPPTPNYNPNINNNSSQPSSVNDSNFQVVPGPNGVSVPVGQDGKPLHPGVLIMNHEKRISDLEKSLSDNSRQMRSFDENAVNFVIEEGESAPWEEDIGMLNLKLDDFNKRIFSLEQTRHQVPLSNVHTHNDNANESKVYDLQSKVDLLERQLTTTKELLLKVQSFAMETNTAFLKLQNSLDKNNYTSTILEEEEGNNSLKAWVESGSLNLQSENLDELLVNELDNDNHNEEETECEQ